MTKIYFGEMMEEFGATALDGTAYGARAGYPYSAVLAKETGAPELTFRFVVEESAKAVWEGLKKDPGPHTRWFHEPDGLSGGGVLGAVLRPPSDFYAKAEVHGLLARATAALGAGGLAPPERCPLCENAGGDVYALLGEGYRKAHKSCLDTRLSLPEEDTVRPIKVRGFYITGILGALAGAIIGAAPNFALALSEGRINAPLYAFIPLLAALVYRLCRGKASRTYSNIVVLAVSLGAAFLLELVWFWLVNATPLNYNLSFWYTSALYFETHTFLQTLREMLISLVCLFIGFIPAGFVLRGYARSGTTGGETVRGGKYTRQSVTPVRPPEDESLPGGDDNAFLGANI